MCLYIMCNKKYNVKNNRKLQKYTIHASLFLAHFYTNELVMYSPSRKQASSAFCLGFAKASIT
jgi:hypothetical protein